MSWESGLFRAFLRDRSEREFFFAAGSGESSGPSGFPGGERRFPSIGSPFWQKEGFRRKFTGT